MRVASIRTISQGETNGPKDHTGVEGWPSFWQQLDQLLDLGTSGNSPTSLVCMAAALVLVYLATIAVVGFPIFISELYIGQSHKLTDRLFASWIRIPVVQNSRILRSCLRLYGSFLLQCGRWLDSNYLAMPFTGELGQYTSDNIGTNWRSYC